MMGVISNPNEEDVVREFFELFKIPWEFYRIGAHYDVVLCSASSRISDLPTRVVIIYGSLQGDGLIKSRRKAPTLSFLGRRLPIFGHASTFSRGLDLLTENSSHEPVACVDRHGPAVYVYVGYDLFQEVQRLLLHGQATENAGVPALDLHIQFLRDLITCAGISLMEIPPVPAGYSFIACLTHDIDHACIRRHRFDSTAFGFLYRATIGSVIKVARGRLSLQKLATNWGAAAKLPLMYMGLAKDIWYEFDRYLDLEKGRPSTFFAIPFENRPGSYRTGQAPRARATKYDVSHIRDRISRLAAAGCEIGLHGIDAWCESVKGREEARRVSQVSNREVSGVRMHWLYNDERSVAALEQAGFVYDSTAGYNDTIGYRAGTSQVFKPLGATRLLELPMHIMDTALFYPDYLDLSEAEAWNWVAALFEHSAVHGGVVTVNWHDRSIAPERLWGDFYVRLLEELTARGAWFCTASEAVLWFQKRRSATFQQSGNGDGGIHIAAVDQNGDGLPAFRMRLHRPRTFSAVGAGQNRLDGNYSDTVLTSSTQLTLSSSLN